MARQLSSVFLALLFTLVAFGTTAGPAVAATSGGYTAEVAAAPGADRLVIRDVMWRCEGSSCAGVRGNSRPAIDCAALARKVGRITSFVVAGRPIGADELEKCNARAR